MTFPAADTADDILSAEDLEIVPVEVKEWKRTVHLRVLSAAEGIVLAERLAAAKTDGMVVIVGACLVAPNGTRLFADKEIERLKTKSLAVIGRLQSLALKINNLRPDAENEAKNESRGAALAASPIA